MSRTIDERVVSMQFDNKQFETNVRTSMNTIDKLKQKLNFNGATKGLENIEAATKNVNMQGLGSAVDAVSAKFSALQVVGITTLANLTNSAINTGKRMISALTVDPIKTGFGEYETQIGAIQTILANTQHEGTNLQQVNRALDELNQYADKTIYNFTEMTRNIGTFTAAGVKLQTSVDSIKGIANLAAVSGSTSQQASTAMYQLSQALAAGKVQLMDWNSVVNAGMGGKVFQDALIRTSELLGTGAEAAIKQYGSFRESLTKGEWLTTEVLTETLKQFAGAYSEADLIQQGFTKQQASDIAEMAKTAEEAATKVKTFTQLWDTLKESTQSGWTESWEIMIGDFEEAKDLLTKISDTIGGMLSESANARNALLSEGLSSGWKQLLKAGIADEAGYIDSIREVAKKSGTAFDDLVTSVEKDGGSFQDALKKALEDGTVNANTLSDAVSNLKKKMSGMSVEERKAAGYTNDMVELIEALESGLKDGSVSMDEFVSKILRPSGRENIIQAMWNSFNRLLSVVKPVKEAFREIFPAMTGDQLYSITEQIRDFTSNLELAGDKAEKVKSIFKGVFSIFDIGAQAASAIIKPLITFLGGDSSASIIDNLLTAAASVGDFFTELNKGIKAGNGFSVVSEGLTKVLGVLGDAVAKITSGFGGIGDVLTNVWDTVSSVGGKIFNVFGKIGSWIFDNISAGDIFAGLAGGSIFLGVKSFTDLLDKIKGILDSFGKNSDTTKTGISDVLGAVKDSLISLQTGVNVISLVAIAGAVMLLSSAMRSIAQLKPEEILASLASVGVLVAIMSRGFQTLSKIMKKFPTKNILTTGIFLMSMAKSVDILAGAMAKFKGMSWDDLAKGLLGIGASLLGLTLVVKKIGKDGVNLRTSIAMLALAEACKGLADALSKFGSMSWDEIARGLIAMGGALAEFVIALTVLNKVSGGKSIVGAVAMLIAVQALDEISECLERLGALSWDEIARGLVAMGGALTEFVAALGVLGKVGGFSAVVGSVAIFIASKSLDEISECLERLGSLSWDEIARGLVSMGIALAEFVAALGVLGKVGGFSAILGGAAILIAAQALDEISEILERTGSMSWGEIGKGLSAMGGALLELGVISGVLGKLAGASGLLGAGTLVIGAQVLSPVADALSKFGSMSWDEIARGLVGMAGALLSLATISGLLGKLAGFSGLIGAGTLVLGVQALGPLAEALTKFGSLNWDEIARGLVGMGGALLELGVISGVLGKLGGFSGLIGAGTLVLSVQALEPLADSFAKFGSMSWDEIARGLVGMGGALTEVGVISGLLGNLGGFMSLVGSGSILLISQGLGQIADALIKFGSMSWDEIDKGISAMGDALAELSWGGFLNTLSVIGSASIAVAAKPLGDLADSVKKWGDVKVPDDLGAKLAGLGGGITAFTLSIIGGASIAVVAGPLGTLADSVSKWSEIKFPAGIGTNLMELANGVTAFTSAFLGGFTVEQVAAPIGVMAESLGKWNEITFPTGIKQNLTDLAGGIKEFSIFSDAKISGVGVPLGEIAEALSKWKDITVPDTLVEDMGLVADAVKEFSVFDKYKISGIGTPLGEVGTALHNWNGIYIPSNIVEGVGYIVTCIRSLNGLDLSKLGSESVTTAISNIDNLIDTINRMGTVDESSAAKFNSAIAEFGKVGVEGIVNSLNNGAADVNAAITGLVNAMSTTLVSSADLVTPSAETLGTTIAKLVANGISAGSDSIPASMSAIISTMMTSLSIQAENFAESGRIMAKKFSEGFKSESANLGSNAKQIMAFMPDAIKSKESDLTQAVVYILGKLNLAITQNTPKALMSIRSMSTALISNIRAQYSSFYDAGGYLTIGFANGITAYTYKAAAQSRAMASAAAEAARKELDEHSPSKVGYEIGDYFGVAFVNAISSYTKKAYNAGTDIATEARLGLAGSMSRINSLINSDMGSQPVIRPVLDLSAVKSGVSAINGLFHMNPSIGTTTNLGAISTMTSRRSQNGTSDIVSALNDLNKKFDNLPSGDTYTIGGVSYQDGSDVSNAIKVLVRAMKMEGRV